MPTPPNVTLIYLDAGGGHRSAALALAASIATQGHDWDVELLDLQLLLDRHDPIRRLTGIRMQDVYNHGLRRGWTLGAELLVPVLHGIIRAYHAKIVARLKERWTTRGPDMVVSVIPHFNRAIAEGVRSAIPRAPFATILTDLADFPPHFWIEPESQYVVCGTELAAEQALAIGVPADGIYRTSGMPVHPRFYPEEAIDVGSAREQLGLDRDTPTGLLMFGGEGSHTMIDIVRRLDAVDRNLQLLVLCGRNKRLAERIRSLETRNRIHVEEFTSDVPRFLAMSDFLIGKPGPGALSEALQLGVPVIVARNAWTLPQERHNVDWILERRVGMCVRSFSTIATAVNQMLEPAVLAGFRERAAAIQNRAVFEIPVFLQDILERQNAQPFRGTR